MNVWVGSAKERSSFGSLMESSSSELCVDFSSEERIVDFPEDVVLCPVVGRVSTTGGDDTSWGEKTCRRGECCGFFCEIIEILSVISFRNAAVFVIGASFIVECLISGE